MPFVQLFIHLELDESEINYSFVNVKSKTGWIWRERKKSTARAEIFFFHVGFQAQKGFRELMHCSKSFGLSDTHVRIFLRLKIKYNFI